MPYDFANLNPQSFQRLVEALAMAEMGPGGEVYSSGPDAGRDFSFQGTIKGYESKGWEGYLVLQAKFQENPPGGDDSIGWLLKEIKKEFDRYSDKSSGRIPPNYYIVATNISLSGADVKGKGGAIRQGGITKIKGGFNRWQSELSLEDFDIWSFEKISRLLDKHSGIRRTYAAWITPGDVLARLLDSLKLPEFATVVRRAMRKALPRDQYVQLKDAGDANDSGLRASQVFIDLPITNIAEPHEKEEPDEYVVARLIDRCKDKLNFEFSARHNSLKDGPSPNLVVILGGPGQGKSTLGKFLVQLHRASLISRDQSYVVDPNIRELAPEILERGNAEGVGAPGTRYPVHIVLPRYADALIAAQKEGGSLSLLAFIAKQIGEDADSSVDRESLRAWLTEVPWLVVLDGLDEVPPSGARQPVIEAINGFVSEVADHDADTLVVVTTRPQGFNNDLPVNVWQHWILNDLPPERALSYAERLGTLRHPHDIPRRSELLARLGQASRNPATARIMTSPLQVTILYVIADGGGDIPSIRWSLFQRYYDVLMQREMAKGGEILNALKFNLQHVNRLHRWAGLVLHVISEVAGGANAVLSRDRFEALLRACLVEGGVADDEIDERVRQLVHVALNRLVLLAARQEELISFDVRSLQEFMAASALTTGADNQFASRLKAVAIGSHWRQVVLISLSRCYAEGSHEHLRSVVLALARELDNNSPADESVLTGARLAFELFRDGVAVGSSVHRAAIAEHALLQLAIDDFDPGSVRLATLLERSTESKITATLRDKMASQDATTFRSAWKLAMELASKDFQPAIQLVLELWPDQAALQLELLRCVAVPISSVDIAKKLRHAALQSSPAQVLRILQDISLNERSERRKVEATRLLLDLDFNQSRSDNRQEAPIKFDGKGTAMALLIPVIGGRNYLEEARELRREKNGWSIFYFSMQFLRDPTKATLSNVLLHIADEETLDVAHQIRFLLPWPISTLLDLAKSSADVRVLAKEAETGLYGDKELWLAAEHRWIKLGVSKSDLLAPLDKHTFGKLATVGVPVESFGFSVRNENGTGESALSLGLAAVKSSLPDKRQSRLCFLATFGMSASDYEPQDTPAMAKDCLKIVECQQKNGRTDFEFFSLFGPTALSDEETASRLDSLAPLCLVSNYHSVNINPDGLLAVPSFGEKYRNLLYPMVMAVIQSGKTWPKLLRRLRHSAFSYRDDDSAIAAAAVALLRVLKNHEKMTSFEEEAGRVLAEGEPYNCLALALRVASGPLSGEQSIVSFLLALLKGTPKSSLLRGTLRDQLRGRLDARRSGLADKKTWDALGLPAGAFPLIESGLVSVGTTHD